HGASTGSGSEIDASPGRDDALDDGHPQAEPVGVDGGGIEPDAVVAHADMHDGILNLDGDAAAARVAGVLDAVRHGLGGGEVQALRNGERDAVGVGSPEGDLERRLEVN